MIRKEFLKELEDLLQDMDVNDREDALAYYRDYMDEAGILDDDQLDSLFEHPEKIAMSIRASLNDQQDMHIESDETGFKNSYVESTSNVPGIYGENNEQEKKDDVNNDKVEHEKKTDRVKTPKLGKILLIIILGFLAAPLILGIGGIAFGLLAAVFATVLGIIVGIAGASVACVVGGIVLAVMGVIALVTSLTKGIFMLGVALLMIAAGIIFTMLTGLVFKRILPGLIQGVVGLIRKIFHRNGGGSL